MGDTTPRQLRALSQCLRLAEPHFEPPLRTAAQMLGHAADFTSTIVEGPFESAHVGTLESLVASIASEFNLEGSLHLHSHSYVARFTRRDREVAGIGPRGENRAAPPPRSNGSSSFFDALRFSDDAGAILRFVLKKRRLRRFQETPVSNVYAEPYDRELL